MTLAAIQQYTPGPVPDITDPAQVGVYLDDELTRIGNAFSDLLAELLAAQPVGLVPAGTVIAWPNEANTPGPTWHFCAFSQLSELEWPQLFAAIGHIYTPPGEVGGGLFRVPEYRGWFLRARNAAAGNDPDANTRTARPDGFGGDVAGSTQLSQNITHTHGNAAHSHGASGSTVATFVNAAVHGSGVYNNGVVGQAENAVNVTVNPAGIVIDNEGGSQARPINIYVDYYIFGGLQVAP